MRSFGDFGRRGALPGVNEDVRASPNEELVMTERQQRLQDAGLRLFRWASVIGGLGGVFVFATVLTGQQRLVFVILLGVVAMPLVLIGLAVAGSMNVTSDPKGRPGTVNAVCLVGAAFINAVLFVNPDLYVALAFVAVSGAVLTVGVRMAAPHRRAGRLP